MDEEEDAAMGIPEWVVTFGDMMSLLLTFFIMLVSMSEIKQEKAYQAMVESVRKQFGHDLSHEAVMPGDVRARKSAYRVQSTSGRAKKKDTMNGGVPTPSPVGEHERVRIVRPSNQTAIGTVIFFANGEVTLSDENRQDLDKEAAQLQGKPQKIEIRGHTSRVLAAESTGVMEPMDMAYQRGREVMKYLVEKHQIPAERIRLSTAGPFEPMFLSADPEKAKLNPRVEVFLLDETVDDSLGTVEERSERVIATP